MRWIVLLAVVLGAMLLSRAFPEALSTPGAVAGLVLSGAWLVWMLSGSSRFSRRPVSTNLRDAMLWVGLFAALVLAYGYRHEFRDAKERFWGALIPGRSHVVGGERPTVSLGQRGGHFWAEAEINRQAITMMVDTGASTIVIPYEEAERLGIDPENLAFIVNVSTAKGMARAAPVFLKEIALGPIVMKDARAMVSERGTLKDPLLGMSFLKRLRGYAVEGDRMILTGH